jgi:hypothetical protein
LLKSDDVCLFAQSLCYPEGGGHFWVYLNWALGFLANGRRVWWMDSLDPNLSQERGSELVAILKQRLAPHGLADSLIVVSNNEEPLSWNPGTPDLSAAAPSSLLVNFRYGASRSVLDAFPRKALLDIDPGLLQHWAGEGQLKVQPHDLYFTIGETVGEPGSAIPDLGLRWHKVRPCVSLELWPPASPAPGAAFTTITHWSGMEWLHCENGASFDNSKRSGFMPFATLPTRTRAPLELAAYFGKYDQEDVDLLRGHGWKLRPSYEIASTPEGYASYIRDSLGEFSAVKPSCIHFQNAWISDRSVCFLASGKPVIVQNTGPSSYLPDAAGLWRFHDLEGAARALDAVMDDYDRQCRLARALAERYFCARTNAARILEIAG